MGYVSEIRKKIGHDMLLMVGASVFAYSGDQVLLQKRKDNGCWGPHGGAVEVGEDVESAARRELYEETGLRAQKLRLLGVFSGRELLYTYPNGDNVSIVSVCYVCDEFEGEIRPQADEVSELSWFDIAALPDAISEPDRPACKAFAKYARCARDGKTVREV